MCPASAIVMTFARAANSANTGCSVGNPRLPTYVTATPKLARALAMIGPLPPSFICRATSS